MRRGETSGMVAGRPAGARWPAAVLALALAMPALGCVEQEPYARAVWSDTDESWLVVRGSTRIGRCGVDWDCEPSEDTLNHALWVYPVDGGEPRRLLGRRSGAAYSIYFMQSAGYVLVNHERQWERIDLDGEVRVVDPRTEGPTRVYFPSPDGSILARVVRSDCSTTEDVPDCTYRVSFLDAQSLEAIGGTAELRLHDVHGGFDRLAWGPGGEHLHIGSRSESARIGIDGSTEEGGDPLACSIGTTIGTTSSRVSADGRWVDARVVDGDLELRVRDSDEPGWPERCFPPEG